MGAKHSQPKYPPLDPLFKDIACVGFGEEDRNNDRLNKAPFYTETFEVGTYDEMISKVILNISNLKPVCGPIYLLTASDSSKHVIRCYLMYPSMSKTTPPEALTKTYALGSAHLWLNNILYGLEYNLKPYSSCMIRIPTKKVDVNEHFTSIKEKIKNAEHSLAKGVKKAIRKIVTHHKNQEPNQEPIDYSLAFMHGCYQETATTCRKC
jgi:hypothetical protein